MAHRYIKKSIVRYLTVKRLPRDERTAERRYSWNTYNARSSHHAHRVRITSKSIMETVHRHAWKEETIYHGGNIDRLEHARTARGFKSYKWATLLDWNAVGMFVNKGEKGTWCERIITETVDKKTGKKKDTFARKYFKLFNREQVHEATCPKCKNPLGKNPRRLKKDGRTLVCSQCADVEAIQVSLQ